MQLAFMRSLWQAGEGTVGQIQETLAGLGFEFAPTTVATVLRRLEAKGYVSHRVDGRTFLYRAKKSERQLSKSLVSQLAGNLFGGNIAPLLCHLVASDELSPDDLAAIKAVIAEKESGQNG